MTLSSPLQPKRSRMLGSQFLVWLTLMTLNLLMGTSDVRIGKRERDVKLDIKEHPFYDIFSTGKSVAAQTRTEDYWSYDEEQNTYTRHHLYLRKRRFVPVDQGLTVPCQHFLAQRIAIKDNDETEVKDDWTENGAFNEGGWWTGKTMFQCCPSLQADIEYSWRICYGS